MEYDRSSSVSARDFENTAIKKLQAEGVPYNVAHAFVTIGIVQKSQNYEKIRDAVCPMKYQQFFIPRSDRDFSDPLRKGGPGAMVPQVLENKQQRFYTEFSMSDIDAVKFAKAFPEFHVVSNGKTFNQHAFYANKRYAETELLVSMVYRHALANTSDYDPRKLIDLGGNAVWHEKRDRAYVHCDNPVLGPRDKARYVTREIFSGEDPASVCRHRYQDCPTTADYTIAVHSTYDLSPKKIAQMMMSKSVKVFYGVVNIIPGLDEKKEGVYEVDGMVVTVCRPRFKKPFVKYTFKHDTALEYTHGLSDLAEYSRVKCKYDFVDAGGNSVSYIYKIESVRGNTTVFSIIRGEGDYSVSSAKWSVPRSSTYTLSIPQLGADSLEVQKEFFDRLVMEAAGSRRLEDYDITALFKYAKSLRQRVSINGMVLSSGYCMHPDELITAVIAAYCIAAAYRRESARYFKKATSQIVLSRSRGFFRDVFTISAVMVKSLVDSVMSSFASLVWYDKLAALVKRWDDSTFPVSVSIDKPHAGKGIDFDPAMIQPLPTPVADTNMIRVPGGAEPFTKLDIGGWGAKLRSTTIMDGDRKRRFFSYGLPLFSQAEKIRPGAVIDYDFLFSGAQYPVKSEEHRRMCNSRFLFDQLGLTRFSDVPVVLSNGDRLFRPVLVSEGERARPPMMEDQFVGVAQQYVVIRGVGTRAVALPKPKAYQKGNCILFVLMYEHDDDSIQYIGKKKPGDHVSTATATDATLQCQPSSGGVPDIELDVQSVRSGLGMHNRSFLAKRYATEQEARASVQADIDAGYYTMTGAVRHDGPLTPLLSPASTPLAGAAVVRTVRAPPSEPGVGDHGVSSAASDATDDLLPLDSDAVVRPDADAVVSSILSRAVLPTATSSAESESQARLALEEYIGACVASERIAIESSRQCILLARAAADPGDTFSYSKWSSAVQGMPGSQMIVRVVGDQWYNCVDDTPIEHMAVSDGEKVFDRLVQLPRDGIYVTSDVMRVYTGAAIKNSMELALDSDYDCDVISMNGVAGSGKTTTIVERALPSHVVLCETRAALIDTKSKLLARRGACQKAYTVDSYLTNRPPMDCDVLWIDESFRLHAAKIYALVKLLRPSRVYCFGDIKQIPVLPYIPDFDFSYHMFPFTSTETKRDTWRCPADVCLALSTPEYYNALVVTHNPVKRSIKGPEYYDPQMFHAKPHTTTLLVYTQSQKEDFVKQGIKNVMTIGESQGSTFDDVVLFRDSPLMKALYFDVQQTLVAFTRHRKSFTYVTATAGEDNSAAYKIIQWLRDNISDLKLAMHTYREDSDESELDNVVEVLDDESDVSIWDDYDNSTIGS